MEILIFLCLILVAFVVISTVLAVVFSAMMMLVTACAVALPLWFGWKYWASRNRPAPVRQSSLERLKTLYIEGKIDLFEFERRAATLIAVEH